MSTTFPGQNDGAVPLDPATPVGQFRVLALDAVAESYDPPVPGRGNYKLFSDADIEGSLAAAEGSLPRAIGFAYLALAGAAASESKHIRDFDLTVDTTKRAADLRLVAYEWFGRADKEEAALQDAFFIAPLGDSCDPVPEGMTPTWGRYAVGKWSC